MTITGPATHMCISPVHCICPALFTYLPRSMPHSVSLQQATRRLSRAIAAGVQDQSRYRYHGPFVVRLPLSPGHSSPHSQGTPWSRAYVSAWPHGRSFPPGASPSDYLLPSGRTEEGPVVREHLGDRGSLRVEVIERDSVAPPVRECRTAEAES